MSDDVILVISENELNACQDLSFSATGGHEVAAQLLNLSRYSYGEF